LPEGVRWGIGGGAGELEKEAAGRGGADLGPAGGALEATGAGGGGMFREGIVSVMGGAGA